MSESVETLTGSRSDIVGSLDRCKFSLETLIHRQMHIAVLLDEPGEQEQRTLDAFCNRRCPLFWHASRKTEWLPYANEKVWWKRDRYGTGWNCLVGCCS